VIEMIEKEVKRYLKLRLSWCQEQPRTKVKRARTRKHFVYFFMHNKV